jgi:fucose permease
MSEQTESPTSALRKFMQRHGILIALVVLAAFFYAIGYRKGSTLAIILAVIFEIFFWARLLRRG